MVNGATIKLSSQETHEFWEIPVVFEDSSILALNKPAKLLCAPESNASSLPNLLKLLHQGIEQKKTWAVERQLSYLRNIHRLDFEATGIILFAKSKGAFARWADLSGSGGLRRTYIAICRGEPKAERFAVNAKLAASSTAIPIVRVDRQRGKISRTEFQVLETFKGWTLLNCAPEHDRPDQIQAHLRHAALPIAGAVAYGGRPLLLSSIKPNYRLKPQQTERPLLSRAALHAEQLAFRNPDTDKPQTLSAPWPKDIMVAVKYLRIFARTERHDPASIRSFTSDQKDLSD